MNKRIFVLGFLSSLGVLTAHADDICNSVPQCVNDLREAVDAFADGLDAFVSHAAAEAAQRMDKAHDAALEATGVGLYYGAQRSALESWGDVTGIDCTSYMLTVLKAAFDAADLGDQIRDLISDAATEGGGSLKGIDVMQLLQERFDWEGVYWNPDTKTPSDGQDEHPYSAYLASKGGYYGIDVDPDRAVTNYRPSWNGSTTQDLSGIEALELLPFGVLAARGGRHMAVVVYGEVYECHWLTSATSEDVITDIPLSEWDWLSGAIVYPPGTWPSQDQIDAARAAKEAQDAELEEREADQVDRDET
jgi:hypothetical protein